MTTSIQPVPSAAVSRGVLRSIGATVAAIVVMAVLAGIVDQILHWLGVFPPWGQFTYDAGPYALAVAYRALFGVAGGWVVARLAPRAPLKHAIVLGIIGIVLNAGATVVAATQNFGPVWYPIVLGVVSLPTAWLGGKLQQR